MLSHLAQGDANIGQAVGNIFVGVTRLTVEVQGATERRQRLGITLCVSQVNTRVK